VNDGAGANEADPGNDLCRNPGVIASVLACQLVGKQGEHGGTHADEQVGAQSGRAMFRLALQTNQSAESCRQQQLPKIAQSGSHVILFSIDFAGF